MSEVRLGRRWAHGRRLRRGARRELADVAARLAPQRDAVRGLLRRAVRASGDRGVRVRPEEAVAADTLADSGVIRLEEKVEGTAAEPRWTPWRATVPDDIKADVREWLGIADPVAARTALLATVGTPAPPTLAREVELLAAQAADATLRPPGASVLAGCTWSVYAAALRAALVWSSAVAAGQRPSARELAAQALGWSKAWTPARRDAFSRLVGEPFDRALSTQERFIRIRGPVSWTLGSHTADARSAVPWLGLPESAVAHVSLVASEAAGTLVVENLETFEELCRHSLVPGEWVCVFGHGYASRPLVTLLGRLPTPLAAWGDLDPHGLAIIADLSRRLALPVHPVGMDALALHSPHAVNASEGQKAEARRLACELGPPLRGLAAAMVATSRVVEQEAVHSEVLRRLPEDLILCTVDMRAEPQGSAAGE